MLGVTPKKAYNVILGHERTFNMLKKRVMGLAKNGGGVGVRASSLQGFWHFLPKFFWSQTSTSLLVNRFVITKRSVQRNEKAIRVLGNPPAPTCHQLVCRSSHD
jgi:hypothetical protein